MREDNKISTSSGAESDTEFHINQIVVFAPKRGFKLTSAAFYQGLNSFYSFFQGRAVFNIPDAHGKKFFFSVAGQFTSGIIDFLKASLDVNQEIGVSNAAQNIFVFFFGQLALCHIADKNLHSRLAHVGDWSGGNFNVDGCSVNAKEFFFCERYRFSLQNRLFCALHSHLSIIRVDKFYDGSTDKLFGIFCAKEFYARLVDESNFSIHMDADCLRR